MVCHPAHLLSLEAIHGSYRRAHDRGWIAIFRILLSIVIPIACCMPHADVVAKFVGDDPDISITIA